MRTENFQYWDYQLVTTGIHKAPLIPTATGRDAVAQWLRCRATIRKIAGSIPAGVGESIPGHYGPGIDSVYNRNEYQEYFLGVKAAGA